jgi:creatinine amidohydrolase/Fe(II)-dependent formamide hydrolase-like protein
MVVPAGASVCPVTVTETDLLRSNFIMKALVKAFISGVSVNVLPVTYDGISNEPVTHTAVIVRFSTV